jgi:hypothetical protein
MENNINMVYEELPHKIVDCPLIPRILLTFNIQSKDDITHIQHQRFVRTVIKKELRYYKLDPNILFNYDIFVINYIIVDQDNEEGKNYFYTYEKDIISNIQPKEAK